MRANYRMTPRNTRLRRETGMTTLGMIILVTFIGLFVFAGLRLVPVYLNYMKVVGAVDGVREEFDGKGASPTQIRQSIERRFDIEDVKVIKYRDVKVSSADGGYEVAATYDHTEPFIANVSFTVHFDKRAIVRR
jgi:hypothetical protein